MGSVLAAVVLHYGLLVQQQRVAVAHGESGGQGLVRQLVVGERDLLHAYERQREVRPFGAEC